MLRKTLSPFVRLLVAGLFLTSCGGEGGSSASLPPTGQVYVLIADGPDEDYDHVFLTVHEVSLLPAKGGGSDVVLFHSGKGVEFDLLDLEDEDFLLGIGYEVPAGTYSKIRMRVSKVRAVGGPCETLAVKLPSGKIDINPGKSFAVVPGGTLSIMLDVRAHESLHLHVAGSSGKCIFRPVVFAQIKAGSPTGRCPRPVRGTISELLLDGGRTTGFVMTLYRRDAELEVALRADTVIFDERGLPAGPGALEVGQDVRVRGRLNGIGQLEALAIVIGDVLAVEGIVGGPVEDGIFPFKADPDQGVAEQLKVQVSDATFILYGCDNPVDLDAIQAGMPATLLGKTVSRDNSFRAVVVLLRPATLRGDLTDFAVAAGGRRMTLRVRTASSDPEDVSLYLPAGAPVRLKGDGAVSRALLGHLAGCAPRPAEVALDPIDPQRAEALSLESDSGKGDVISVNPAARTMRVGREVVRVVAGAAAVDLRDGTRRLTSLGEIPIGASVAYFGLEACPEDAEDFRAFVILLVP